jgi:hypothetical protein
VLESPAGKGSPGRCLFFAQPSTRMMIQGLMPALRTRHQNAAKLEKLL